MARFLIAIAADPAAADLRVEFLEVNGGPAIVASAAGVPVTVLTLDLADGLVQTVHLVANPDKLTRLARPPNVTTPPGAASSGLTDDAAGRDSP